MPYAVAGYFDKSTDGKIKALWKGMADTGVCHYMIESANDPHIKFAMFDGLDLDAAKERLCLLTGKTGQIPLHFKSYSFYPNTDPFLCIDIAVSSSVLHLHAAIHNTLGNIGTGDYHYYFGAGLWKPDCQLTIGIEKAKLAKAVQYLAETQLPFDGMLERVGVIEFHPAKQLFACALSQ